MGSQESMMSAGASKGKADPKGKPAGKAPAKGGDEKNVPRSNTIEYPEVPAEPNFIIMEKSFSMMKNGPEAKKPQSKSSLASRQGGEGQPTQTLEQKKHARLVELKGQYDIVRGLQQNVAVVVKLNVPPPPPEQVSETTPID